jgi:GNAT superfamily N-acetyltransferase
MNPASVFINGFAHLQHRLGGSPLEHVAGIPVVRFGPAAHGRSAEFFALDVAPAHAHAAAQAAARSQGYWITAIEPLGVSSADSYSALGYAFEGQEWLMTLPLNKSMLPTGLAQHVHDPAIIAQINAAGGRRVFPTTELDRPDLTIVAVLEAGAPIAWGGQVWATPQHPYVTHIHTLETHRRRGLALSIMHALLHEAFSRGATTSVLAATAMGRSLYQRLGYQDVAHIRIWQSPPLES